MVVLAGVEVRLGKLVLAARPDHRAAKTHCEPGLEVDSGTMQREVGHHKLSESDLGEDSVADLAVVVDLVNTDRLKVAIVLDGWADSVIIGVLKTRIEGHRNEGTPDATGRRFKRYPTLDGEDEVAVMRTLREQYSLNEVLDKVRYRTRLRWAIKRPVAI